MQGSKNDWLLVRTSGGKKNVYEQFYSFEKGQWKLAQNKTKTFT